MYRTLKEKTDTRANRCSPSSEKIWLAPSGGVGSTHHPTASNVQSRAELLDLQTGEVNLAAVEWL